MTKRFLVTGGAGFIGSAVVRHLFAVGGNDVLVLDKLTYAATLTSLAPVSSGGWLSLREGRHRRRTPARCR